MTVTVVSCIYGREYSRFAEQWADAISKLNPAPNAVVVAADRSYAVTGADVRPTRCQWKHPQAWYLQNAVWNAETDWVWIVDIDDLAKRDGLAGLEDVDADVWQLGFQRSDGERYCPPQLTPYEYLASEQNPYVGSSMIRPAAFRACGGYPDVALQDWALWRRLARQGATFEASTRTHFLYNRHPRTRGAIELTIDHRADHLAEMMEAELAYA